MSQQLQVAGCAGMDPPTLSAGSAPSLDRAAAAVWRSAAYCSPRGIMTLRALAASKWQAGAPLLAPLPSRVSCRQGGSTRGCNGLLGGAHAQHAQHTAAAGVW